MKKYAFIQILFLGILFMTLGCYKDKGNYDYESLPTIQMGGKSYNQDNYVVQQRDTLKIDAEFEYDGDSTKLEYKWYLARVGARPGDPSIKLISTDRNLRYEVLNAMGGYTVQFTIVDPVARIERSRNYGVNITLRGSSGFMVLNTKSDNTQDIDVIVNNTLPGIVKGMYSANNVAPLTGAKDLYLLMNLANGSPFVFVYKEDDGFALDFKFEIYQTMKDWFNVPPAKYAPGQLHADVGFSTSVYFVNDGRMHLPNRPTFPFLLLYPAAGDYKISKALFMGGNNVIIFDDKNKRFMRYNRASETVSTFVANGEDKFNLSGIGNKSCFYFDHNSGLGAAPSVNLKPVAYCRDNVTGQVFAYRLGFFRSLAVYAESLNEITDNSFKQASAYLNSITNSITYYGHENKIYAYDISSNTSRVLYTFEDNDISIGGFKTNGTQLMAFTNAKGKHEGKVYFFNINAAGSLVGNNYVAKYEGFGKIEDVEYKYPMLNVMGPFWK